MTKIQKDIKPKGKKKKRQRPKREFNIATSGQFRTLAMFFAQMGTCMIGLGNWIEAKNWIWCI